MGLSFLLVLNLKKNDFFLAFCNFLFRVIVLCIFACILSVSWYHLASFEELCVRVIEGKGESVTFY